MSCIAVERKRGEDKKSARSFFFFFSLNATHLRVISPRRKRPDTRQSNEKRLPRCVASVMYAAAITHYENVRLPRIGGVTLHRPVFKQRPVKHFKNASLNMHRLDRVGERARSKMSNEIALFLRLKRSKWKIFERGNLGIKRSIEFRNVRDVKPAVPVPEKSVTINRSSFFNHVDEGKRTLRAGDIEFSY